LVTLDLLDKQIPLRVVGSARLFPTIVRRSSSFVVLDYDTLFAALNADEPGLAAPSEAWFFRPQPAFGARLAGPAFRFEQAVGVQPLQASLLSDPLAAGARAVLGVAALVAAALCLAALVLAVRSALVSERLLLAEYEALGVPPLSLRRAAQLRLAALSLLGIGAGLLGAFVSVRLITAFVVVTGTASRPLPPIEPVVPWATVASIVAAIGVAAMAASALLAGRALRETAARRLRA
jgi:hypothetical protein